MSDKAMEVLRMRLAKGDIGIEEFSLLEAHLLSSGPNKPRAWVAYRPLAGKVLAILLVGFGILMAMVLFFVPQWNVVTMILLATLSCAGIGGGYALLQKLPERGRDTDAT